MARQTGIIKVTGLLDGISYYQSPWGMIARRKGGASKERIKTAPEFENVRRHNAEFGNCSRAGAFLRKALMPFWFEKKVHARAGDFLQLMSDLMKLDGVSSYGSRSPGKGMSTVEGKKLVSGKSFEGKCLSARVFPKDLQVNLVNGGWQIELDCLPKLMKLPRAASFIEITFIRMSFDLDQRCALVLEENKQVFDVAVGFSMVVNFAASNPINELVILRFEFFRQEGSGGLVAVKDERWRYMGVLMAG